MKTQFLSAILVLLALCFSPGVYAKDGDIKAPFVWFAVGGGLTTINTPQNVVDADKVLMGEIGGEFKLFGPVYIPIAAIGSVTDGLLQYDYTAPDNTHYTKSDMTYTATASGLRAGIKIRFINSPNIHLYADGGFFATTFTMNYGANLTTVGAQGTSYISQEKDLWDVGEYVEAGLDVLFMKYGIRLAARTQSGSTDKVKALNDQSLKHKDAIGFVAFVKEL